jgi:hypothetical protein
MGGESSGGGSLAEIQAGGPTFLQKVQRSEAEKRDQALFLEQAKYLESLLQYQVKNLSGFASSLLNFVINNKAESVCGNLCDQPGIKEILTRNTLFAEKLKYFKFKIVSQKELCDLKRQHINSTSGPNCLEDALTIVLPDSSNVYFSINLFAKWSLDLKRSVENFYASTEKDARLLISHEVGHLAGLTHFPDDENLANELAHVVDYLYSKTASGYGCSEFDPDSKWYLKLVTYDADKAREVFRELQLNSLSSNFQAYIDYDHAKTYIERDLAPLLQQWQKEGMDISTRTLDLRRINPERGYGTVWYVSYSYCKEQLNRRWISE